MYNYGENWMIIDDLENRKAELKAQLAFEEQILLGMEITAEIEGKTEDAETVGAIEAQGEKCYDLFYDLEAVKEELWNENHYGHLSGSERAMAEVGMSWNDFL